MADDKEKVPGKRQEQSIDSKKLARIEKEKKELLASLAGADFSTQNSVVADIEFKFS